MQGTIRSRGKGSWEVTISAGYDPLTGKRIRPRQTIRGRRKDAEALLVQMLNQRDTGIDAPPGKLTVAAYLDRWLKDYAQPRTRPKTYRGYEQMVRVHLVPAIGPIPLTKLRPLHIEQVYSAMQSKKGLTAQTALHCHRVLRQALQQAIRWQLLVSNPADGVEAPRPSRRQVAMTPSGDIQRILDVADRTRYGALIYLAVQTGLRKGELTGLRWQDVDLETSVLHVEQQCQWLPRVGFTFTQPKSAASRRAVALSPATIERLKQHRVYQVAERLAATDWQESGLVFTTEQGRPIDPSNLRRAWVRILKAAGIKLRFHDLRHAMASALLQQGVRMKVVSERMGHTNYALTANTYSHVAPELHADAAERMDAWLTRRAGESGQ